MLVSDLTFSFRLNEVLMFEINKLQHELRYIYRVRSYVVNRLTSLYHPTAHCTQFDT